MMTLAVLPAIDRVMVSTPSVRLSAKMETPMTALPAESTVATPVRTPPTTSVELTPVSV